MLHDMTPAATASWPRPWWAVLAVYLLVSVPAAVVKPVWYDEWFTIRLAELPPADLWGALAATTDMNPPGFYLLTKPFLLDGEPRAVRGPSLVGFGVMLAAVFRVVARRCSPGAAAVAALVPLASAALPFAYEARPYAVVLGSAGLALMFWQSAAAGGGWAARLGLAASLAVGVSSHYYAVLLAVPLGLGEVARLAARRRPDWATGAAIVAGLLPLAAIYPVLAQQRTLGGLWGPPEWAFAQSSFRALFGRAVVPVLAGLTLLAAWPFRRPVDRPDAGAARFHEVVAAAGFALLPLFALLLAKVAGTSLSERYVLPAVVGGGVLAGFAVHRLGAISPRVWLLFAAPIAGWVLILGVWDWLQLRAERAQVAEVAAWVREPAYADLPVLTADPLGHPMWHHYAPPDVRRRVRYVPRPDAATTYFEERRYTVEGALLALDRRVGPAFGLASLDEVIGRGRVLIYGDPARGWVTTELERRGWKVTRIRGTGRGALYLAEAPPLG